MSSSVPPTASRAAVPARDEVDADLAAVCEADPSSSTKVGASFPSSIGATRQGT